MFSRASVSHSVHNRPHSYSVTAHPCYDMVAYAAYWNAFLFPMFMFPKNSLTHGGRVSKITGLQGVFPVVLLVTHSSHLIGIIYIFEFSQYQTQTIHEVRFKPCQVGF